MALEAKKTRKEFLLFVAKLLTLTIDRLPITGGREFRGIVVF